MIVIKKLLKLTPPKWCYIKFNYIKIKKTLLILFCIIILSGCVSNKKSSLKKDYFIASDYDCYLKKIVISLSIDDKSLDKQDSLLVSLPEYTKILLLLPQENVNYINNELIDQKLN